MIMEIKMQPQQLKQLLAAVLLRLLLECIRIVKDAPPDHDPIHTMLLGELEAGLAVRDIAVNRQEGIRRYLIAELLNLVNELPVRRHLAHFLSCPQMDG